MKQTIGFYEFQKAFEEMRPKNFSRNGLIALFDYLEEYENDTGTEIELDVIAICCDYVEYESLDDLNNDYGDESHRYESIEQVEENMTVIPIDGASSFIIQAF